MFKNPQLVHIAIEITVFLAFVFWVTISNRKTNFFIKNLLQKIDDLEDRILKLESLYVGYNKPAAATAVKLSIPTPVASEKSISTNPAQIIPEKSTSENIISRQLSLPLNIPLDSVSHLEEFDEQSRDSTNEEKLLNDEEEQFHRDLCEELSKLDSI